TREIQLSAQSIMLRLRLGRVGGMMKSKLAPAGDPFWLIPSGGARRADQHALQRGDHRVAVEGHGGLRERRRGQASLHALRAAEVILRQEDAWTKCGSVAV
ncbi:MAG: hypothetical protein DMG78_29885, partial [Acidobacteria bacterium]